MNELIRKEAGKYGTYEELLLTRDRLRNEAEDINISYIREFGAHILELFELKIDCIRKKKMIAYCQAAINRGSSIDVSAMNREIREAMALYNRQLQEMIADKDRADKAEAVPEYKADRAKRIYRRLAKLIHPDINPNTADNKELQELWDRIAIAYRCCDDEELDNLESLVRRALKENGLTVCIPEISDIDERIERLQDEINAILTTEPYTYKDLLSSNEKITEKKQQLDAEIDEYTAYSAELSQILQKLLLEGGAPLQWTEE